jgi:hypothetical protein
MGQLPGVCAFPPCPHPAVVVVRLLVDGCPVEMRACARHRDWFTGYVLEDDGVRLVDVLLEEPVALAPHMSESMDEIRRHHRELPPTPPVARRP